MSILSKNTPAGVGVEIHGPFQPEYFVTINGYRVPYVTIHPSEDARYSVTVDRRVGLFSSVTAEELDNWLPVLADAMAVAAGYSSHGEHCNPLNPFTTRMSRLGPALKPDLSVI